MSKRFVTFHLLSIVILQLLLIGAFWEYLPNLVCLHIDIHGQCDNMLSKWYFFLLPLISSLILLMFAYIERHPEQLNLPNTKNRDLEIKAAFRVIRVLKYFSIACLTLILLFFLKRNSSIGVLSYHWLFLIAYILIPIWMVKLFDDRKK